MHDAKRHTQRQHNLFIYLCLCGCVGVCGGQHNWPTGTLSFRAYFTKLLCVSAAVLVNGNSIERNMNRSEPESFHRKLCTSFTQYLFTILFLVVAVVDAISFCLFSLYCIWSRTFWLRPGQLSRCVVFSGLFLFQLHLPYQYLLYNTQT